MHNTMLFLHGMKKTALRLPSAALCLILILFATPAHTKTFNVAIISSGNNQTYSQIIETIQDSAKQKNKALLSFSIFYVDSLSTTNDNEITNADLLVTIGKRAMIAASQRKTSPPILSTLIPRQAFKQYRPALAATNKRVTAIYIDTAPEKQVLLAKLLLGKLQTVGILVSKDITPGKQQIHNLVKKTGLKSTIVSVSQMDNIIRKLSRVISNSDVLLALPDPLIFNRNTARNILLTTYRKRIPIIGFSANYVKAGALAAVYSTPEQIANQTGKAIIDILDSSSPFPKNGRYPEQYSIAVNRNVAHSLAISVPNNALLKKELQKMVAKLK